MKNLIIILGTTILGCIISEMMIGNDGSVKEALVSLIIAVSNVR